MTLIEPMHLSSPETSLQLSLLLGNYTLTKYSNWLPSNYTLNYLVLSNYTTRCILWPPYLKHVRGLQPVRVRSVAVHYGLVIPDHDLHITPSCHYDLHTYIYTIMTCTQHHYGLVIPDHDLHITRVYPDRNISTTHSRQHRQRTASRAYLCASTLIILSCLSIMSIMSIYHVYLSWHTNDAQ
jgi:hypothetical protein